MWFITAFGAKKSFFVEQTWGNTFSAWDIELPTTSTLQVIISICHSIHFLLKKKYSFNFMDFFLFPIVCLCF